MGEDKTIITTNSKDIMHMVSYALIFISAILLPVGVLIVLFVSREATRIVGSTVTPVVLLNIGAVLLTVLYELFVGILFIKGMMTWEDSGEPTNQQ